MEVAEAPPVEKTDNGFDAFRAALRAACKSAGGQNVWAAQHDFSPAYVSDVLSGRREVSERFAAALGWEIVTICRPKPRHFTASVSPDASQKILSALSVMAQCAYEAAERGDI